MRQVLIAASLLIALPLGGCSWLYQSPYEEALKTANPVMPPPGIR